MCEGGLPPLQGVRFSLTGTYIAAHGGTDGAVIVWDATTGKQVASLHRHSGAVFGLCWAPGNRFATCGQDSLLQISRVQSVAAKDSSSRQDTTVQWERNINMHAGHLNDVDCSPDGEWWASCSDNGAVRIFKSVRLIDLCPSYSPSSALGLTGHSWMLGTTAKRGGSSIDSFRHVRNVIQHVTRPGVGYGMADRHTAAAWAPE